MLASVPGQKTTGSGGALSLAAKTHSYQAKSEILSKIILFINTGNKLVCYKHWTGPKEAYQFEACLSLFL